MEKIKRHSIFISLIFYFGIGLIVAEATYLCLSRWIDLALINQLNPKPDSLVLHGTMLITIFNDGDSYEGMSCVMNQNLFQLLKYIKIFMPIVIFGFSILLTAYIFYRIKLKKQFELLQYSMDKILKQDLDFTLKCNSENEIGMLCNSFELMRGNLQDTFQKLWDAEEKQNLLIRAFSHDLRTPLTILKGNNDVIRCLLDNKDQIENIKQSLTLSDDAIKRIELYSEALKNYKNLEQWEIKVVQVNLLELKENLIWQCKILETEFGKKINVECNIIKVCKFDVVLTQLVLDKMIENALRFAKSKITIKISLHNKELTFLVEDDGDGFSPEAVKYATDIFYSTDKARGHSGMGLAIAKYLLDIYDSHLDITHKESNGACVSFSIKLNEYLFE